MRFLITALLGATAMTAVPAAAADLVLKRAVLGTGGVGYFEYAAEVDGDDTLNLRARLDQVDDILKSVLILDPAGPGSATLPGKAGADEAFASLPFRQGDLDSMPALMAALKGAEISISGPRALNGRIVSVQPETTKDKDGNEITRTRVSILSGVSLEQFILEEAQGLQFADKRLGDQVAAALEAVRASQDRSGRDITIRLAKGGKREVRIGYVAEAPVWKAAYRITLPKDGEKDAWLQGWVVLENMTGNAWKDVAVTLSSASPVTFRQALYDPYYVSRQTIAPPVSQQALPRGDQGQMGLNGAMAGGSPILNRGEMAMAAPSAKMRSMRESLPSPMAAEADYITAQPAPPPSASEENMAGASFTLSSTVSVGAGESLTIPFVDVKTPSEAVSWYQGASKNPWQALTLINNGETSLPPGSATIYEPTTAGPLFSGEAQFPLLPVGDSRLIGFGADQKVTVDREDRSARSITSVKSVDGALQIQSKTQTSTIYRVKNGAAETRKMVIEHPRMQDWTLVQPKAEDARLSGQVYRLRFEVEPGKTVQYPVVMERPDVEVVSIDDVSNDYIQQLIASNELDADTKARLATVAEAARASAESEAELTRLQGERETITADQARLRENLGAAPAGSDLARLYTTKMLEQENALDALSAKVAAAQAAREAARKTLAEKVRAL